MRGKRYPEEFKIQAVKQVVDKGFTMTDVAQRLGVTYKSLYTWVQKYGKPNVTREAEDAQQAEIRKLKSELRRVTEERDILKEAAVYFAGESKKSTRS
jgi:transposase